MTSIYRRHRNSTPPQASVPCMFFCEEFDDHVSSYRIPSLLPTLSFSPLEFRSSIIIAMPLLPQCCPNHFSCFSSSVSIMFCCTFIISLIFWYLLSFFVDFLAALCQKFSVANNLFAYCLPNYQVSHHVTCHSVAII